MKKSDRNDLENWKIEKEKKALRLKWIWCAGSMEAHRKLDREQDKWLII